MRATIVEDFPMQKTIMAIMTAGTIATAMIATPKPAEARCVGCWVGAGVAAGIIGGAIASQGYGYGYPAYGRGYGYPSYGYAPYAYAPAYSGGYYGPRRYYGRGPLLIDL